MCKKWLVGALVGSMGLERASKFCEGAWRNQGGWLVGSESLSNPTSPYSLQIHPPPPKFCQTSPGPSLLLLPILQMFANAGSLIEVSWG